MKLSIIIPVFNEEKTIETLLKKVLAVKLGSVKKEVVVIDDASSDKTREVLSKFKVQSSKFKILSHTKNQGKGAAIRSGIKESTGELIIIQDADLEYDPNDYLKLIKPIQQKMAEVVYGTRLKNYPLSFLDGEKTILPSHLIANRFLTALTNFLYGSNLTDMETCYKLFKRSVLKNITLKSNGFDFEPEITAKILKKGITILEIPIKVKPRSYAEGKKINWIDGVTAIWTLIKYRFTN